MCIMQVHGESHTNNATQACAHNIDTIVNDHNALYHLLIARGKPERAAVVLDRMKRLESEAQQTWEEWRSEVNPAEPETSRAEIGNERSLERHELQFSKWGQNGLAE